MTGAFLYESEAKKMWTKIKDVIKRYWKWIVGGLGVILALVLLGHKNKDVSTYDELKKTQKERGEKAEKVIGEVDKIERETEQLMEDFYKILFERRDR